MVCHLDFRTQSVEPSGAAFAGMADLLKNYVNVIVVLLMVLVTVPKSRVPVPKIAATAPRQIITRITFALIITISPNEIL